MACRRRGLRDRSIEGNRRDDDCSVSGHLEDQNLVVRRTLAIRVLDRRLPAERPERHAVEHELAVSGEPATEALPRARAHRLVVRADVVVQEADLMRNVHLLGE